MSEFEVAITRTASLTLRFKVEAKDEVEAESKAMEEAYNEVFQGEDNASYDVDYIKEL